MQTRAATIHMLDGDTIRLHYRPRRDYLHYKLPLSRKVVVETAKTTRSKIVIARLHVQGSRISPWFELKSDGNKDMEDFAEWWMSGAALANIMLR